MQCPTCSVELKMAERQGVEIDYCPQCRGVWLDRGELDKIIERSTGANRDDKDDYQRQPSGKRKRDEMFDEEGQHTYDGDDADDYRTQPSGRKQPRGFLDGLFDIFD